MTLNVVGASHAGELIIRDARPGDRDRILEVTLAAYQEYAAQMPDLWQGYRQNIVATLARVEPAEQLVAERDDTIVGTDRKSTRLNSSHVRISYAVFCL